jgi:hypothetical protein
MARGPATPREATQVGHTFSRLRRLASSGTAVASIALYGNFYGNLLGRGVLFASNHRASWSSFRRLSAVKLAGMRAAVARQGGDPFVRCRSGRESPLV